MVLALISYLCLETNKTENQDGHQDSDRGAILGLSFTYLLLL